MGNSLSMLDIFLISPAISLFVASFLPLLFKLLNKKTELKKNVVWFLGSLAIGIAWVFNASVSGSLYGGKVLAFSGLLTFGASTFYEASLILICAFLGLVLIRQSKNIREDLFSEYVFLFINSVMGMLLIVWSNELITLFLGIEMMSLPVYAMTVISREKKHTKESAVKYFLLGSTASAFFLLGTSLIYGTSVVQFGDQVGMQIHLLIQASEGMMKADYLYLIGTVLMLLAGCLRLGLFPFHNWVPDVYEGAGSSLTYFMLTAVKFSSLMVLIKLMSAGFVLYSPFIKTGFQWTAAFTMVFGALFALNQNSIKRILAYSGVSQSGFILMAILGFGFDGEGSYESLMVYFVIYVVSLAVLFFALQYLEDKKGSPLNILDLTGLSSRAPAVSFLILLGVFGVSGLPPFAGFISKAFVFKTSIQEGFYWLVFWGLISSGIGVYYYLKIISQIYFRSFDEKLWALWDDGGFQEKTRIFWIGSTAVAIVLFGLAFYLPIKV